MKAPEFRPFVKEDFAEQPWMEKLIRPLNTMLGQIRSGLANGLTLADNLNAEIKTVDLTPPDEWVTLDLENSWAVASDLSDVTPAYHKDSAGNVHFRGEVTGGVFSTTLRVGQVKPAFRPDSLRSCIVESHNAGGTHFPAYLAIDTDGSIYPHSGTGSTDVVLNGVSYQSGSSSFHDAGAWVRFKTKVRGVRGVVILDAVELSDRDRLPVNGIGAVNWVQDGNVVTIRSVTGLVGGSTYRLTLAVFGG